LELVFQKNKNYNPIFTFLESEELSPQDIHILFDEIQIFNSLSQYYFHNLPHQQKSIF
jgi:hypothetical protein